MLVNESPEKGAFPPPPIIHTSALSIVRTKKYRECSEGARDSWDGSAAESVPAAVHGGGGCPAKEYFAVESAEDASPACRAEGGDAATFDTEQEKFVVWRLLRRFGNN